jgi:hypothetical protein
MKISTTESLSRFFAAKAQAPRISNRNISVYTALLHLWQEQLPDQPVQLFRYQIMRLAKISGNAAYFKTMRELDQYGYIKYVPSYKRNQGRKIYFPGN